ncbi:hypothetical protein D9M73_163240 [compost metagenome]
MPDHGDGLVLIHQAVGDGHGLLGLAGVVGLHQLDLLPVETAGGVDHFRRRRRTAPVLFAERGVRAGMRTGNPDHHIRQSKGRDAHRGGHRQGQKAFSENRLRHGVLLLRVFFVMALEPATCLRRSVHK